MIYSHKPQRSGRGIASNTNNPPQDPPAPHEEKTVPLVIDKIPTDIPPVPEITVSKNKLPKPEIPVPEVPDILIEDTTPPVPEECKEEKQTLPKDTLIVDSIPESKPEITVKPKIKVKPQPKKSWFRRLIVKLNNFFRGQNG